VEIIEINARCNASGVAESIEINARCNASDESKVSKLMPGAMAVVQACRARQWLF